ncbi:MAG: DUF1189 family protein, partial [Gammaproteobacteria bacterium]|nr:DUF1189 family protein [Gammaproteobacteria bacterium]
PIKLLPTVYIQNGNVVFDKPMPYLIKNDRGQITTIIDTTGTVTEFTKEYPNLSLLINKNQMAFRLPAPSMMSLVDKDEGGTTLIQPFDKGTNMMFDGKSILKNNSINGLRLTSQLMIYPMVVAIFYSLLFVIFLVLAFLGQVFSTIFFSFKLGFRASCRLFMVASTPMVSVLILFLTFNLIFPGFGFILLALLIVYYSFAIYSLRSESLQMVSR